MATTLGRGVYAHAMGEWQAGVTYKTLSMVTYGGRTYVCAAENTGVIPGSASASAKWIPLTQGSQMDYGENDPTKPGYIKSRPFFYGSEYGTQNLFAPVMLSDLTGGFVQTEPNFKIIPNETYIVSCGSASVPITSAAERVPYTVGENTYTATVNSIGDSWADFHAGTVTPVYGFIILDGIIYLTDADKAMTTFGITDPSVIPSLSVACTFSGREADKKISPDLLPDNFLGLTSARLVYVSGADTGAEDAVEGELILAVPVFDPNA